MMWRLEQVCEEPFKAPISLQNILIPINRTSGFIRVVRSLRIGLLSWHGG
jgi:hypothetical protein